MNLDPKTLAKSTIEAIQPVYRQNERMINTMIRLNPDAIKLFVTRAKLIQALTSGAPYHTPMSMIESVADFGLANFNKTVNAILVGCRTDDITQLTAVYAAALDFAP